MTVSELIQALSELPANMEIVIVHGEWPIKKIHVDQEENKVELG